MIVKAILKISCTNAQETYFDLTEIQSAVDELKPQVSINVPLPKISIPTYSGLIDEWPEFNSLFNSLVHENLSLSNVEKFHYLKSFLNSDAASVISTYQLCGELYPLAYQALQGRYNNKWRLTQLHIDKILNFPKLATNHLGNLQRFFECSYHCCKFI